MHSAQSDERHQQHVWGINISAFFSIVHRECALPVFPIAATIFRSEWQTPAMAVSANLCLLVICGFELELTANIYTYIYIYIVIYSYIYMCLYTIISLHPLASVITLGSLKVVAIGPFPQTSVA